MQKKLISLIFILLIVLFFRPAFAELIIGKSGQKFYGKILEKTDKHVTISSNGVTVNYPHEEIKRIEETELGKLKGKVIRIAVYKSFFDELPLVYEEIFQLIVSRISSKQGFALVPGIDVSGKEDNPFQEPGCSLQSTEECADTDIYLIISPVGPKFPSQTKIVLYGIETGKSIFTVFESLKEFNDQEKENLERTVDEGLNYSKDLTTVFVDEVLSIGKSQVKYNVAAQSGQNIGIEVDYTSIRDKPEIQNIKFIDYSPKQNGENVYEISTQEGPVIKATFKYTDGEDKSRLDPQYAPTDPNEVKKFTIVSQKGYKLDLVCKWQNGEFLGMKIEPQMWPYTVNLSSKDWKVKQEN